MRVKKEISNLDIKSKSPLNGISLESLVNPVLNGYHSRPVISVIIPVYREEKLIEWHLKHFTKELKKKYDFELIVSDGGSNDRTVEMADKYADKIVVHQEERRQTISEGRNRGAEIASGDILVFLNADSIPADLDKFFEMITLWSAYRGAYSDSDALACPVTAFPDEIILKDKIFYTLHNGYVRLLNKLGMGMGRGECQIVRRDVFKRVNGYNQHIVAGEDFDLYRRIAAIGEVSFAKEIHIYESPRRFRKYGYIRTVFYWTLNSLSVWFFGKSVSQEWEAVR
ncbi:MAG: glycosyltransferase [Candidatus Kapaibacterium sp.]